MSDLSIITFNVRGLGDSTKRREVFDHLRDENADVIYLQETHSSKKTQKVYMA